MKKKKTTHIKAAIYIRVSTVEQSDNDFSSLDGQESQCRTWVEQKNQIMSAGSPKISIYNVYKDTKSGKDLNRPGIDLLMKDAKEGKFDLIIVTKVDRISRSLKDFLNFFEKLEEYEIAIAAVTQDIDTSTAAGKALQRMLLVFAEFEREMVSERTREKRIETIKAGLWPGGYQILGYDLSDQKLVINDSEAGLVWEIYNRYLKLKSAVKVANSMDKDGYRNKKWVTKKGKLMGGGAFHKKSVLTILKNHIYLGKYEFEGKQYEGKHDQIIDQATFDKVQELINQNAAEPKSNITSETPAVLYGICSCGFCKNSMTVSGSTKRNNKKYYYYKCTYKNNHGLTEEHNPKDLPVPTLDDFIFRTTGLLLQEPELLTAMKKRIEYEGEDRIKDLNNRIQQIQKFIGARKKDKTNTLKLVTDNATTALKEVYESQLESIVLEIEEKDNELTFLKEQIESLKIKQPVTTPVYKIILKSFTDKYEKNDVNTKRDLTKLLVKNVESHVNQNTNDGIIKVEYIADKQLEAEWKEITAKKNANSKIGVRTSGLIGSPGWI